MKAAHPGLLAMGEDLGRRVPGFDFSNSPAEVAGADLGGRTGPADLGRNPRGGRRIVGGAALVRKPRLRVATAAAVAGSGLGDPTYVITGWRDDEHRGEDDQQTARLIERVRLGEPVRAPETAEAVASSPEAAVTLGLGPRHVDPRDIELATQVDAFDFAMDARRTASRSCS